MATVANNVGPTAPPSGAYPSDEQILGIYDESGVGGNDRADDFDALLAGAERGDDSQHAHAASIPHRAGATNSASVTNSKAAQNAQPQQGIDASMPEWLTRISAADPAAAPELSALWQRSAALDAFDHAFYDGDASAQRQLVTQLYSDSPNALRAMVAAATRLLESSASDSVAPVRRTRGFSNANSDGPQVGDSSQRETKTPGFSEPELQDQSRDAHDANQSRENNSNASAQFNPAAYALFEQSTNGAVVSDVNRAIERALDRALPNGIADGARKRIAGDTLAEVHTALRGDRQLASQVSGALKNSQFDSATRDAIT